MHCWREEGSKRPAGQGQVERFSQAGSAQGPARLWKQHSCWHAAAVGRRQALQRARCKRAASALGAPWRYRAHQYL